MALKHVILGVLNNDSCTGYDIAKKFDDVLGYFWKASHQQIYRELAKLSTSNLVDFSEIKQIDKPDKKIYTITKQGQQMLALWINSEIEAKTKNEEVLVKLYATSNSVKDRKKILLGAKKGYQKQFDHYKTLEQSFFSNNNELSKMDKLVRMTLRKGLLAEKSNIDWCNECLDSE